MLKKQVAVIGAGKSGISSVNFLLHAGYQVTLFDSREHPPGIDMLDTRVEVFLGPLNASFLVNFKLLVVSPGVALSNSALRQAKDAGCEIIGDIELFARALKEPRYAHAKLVTITGSNGKTTVTSLLGEMANATSLKVAIGGNIGTPALDLLAPEIDLYILELSSFQLETTTSLNADIATILNISADHLDRYRSYAHYIKTKHIIYQQCKKALFNADDMQTKPLLPRLNSLSFGSENADFQLLQKNNEIFLSIDGQTRFNVKHLKISGRHNWMNALAALGLGTAVGLTQEAMLSVLRRYSGLAHRCEFVKEVKGVRWINDSKGTNIGATQAALSGLSQSILGKVHVILGGQGKGADFNELREVFDEISGSIFCFGEDASLIAAVDDRIQCVNDLACAVRLAAQVSNSGDIVIFSPACASLDMYKNFMVRGDHFKELVKALGNVHHVEF
ncbi:UDP-N-acetylmuramoyl-L-alanine--D-glutamate ligase [Psychromonas sp. CD1]|uniref:UDP-N-acetylmuramoyl-L-alanine--D-glutamate ligase n=1 Tax=Psychromonas sp. CD1 TaxID=1979839 RepID=UPI000B9B1EB2|nr:UDP-N-acetylmuramoyl-L-alanine--D-glutamate ligase [Psychromonas sp. CD1]